MTTPPTRRTHVNPPRVGSRITVPTTPRRLSDADERQMASPSHEGCIEDEPGHSTRPPVSDAAGAIASNQRTAAILETREGQTLAGGGAADLNPAQRKLAESLGMTPVALAGEHAEITVIQGAAQRGLKPLRGATSRDTRSPGVPNQFMYSAPASFNESTRTLEVLVDESTGQINHVLYK